MIKVFGQTDKTFASNGDIVLQPFKAKVTKKDNGDYFLDLETSLEYVDYLTEGRIVTANTPTGDQAFRVGNVTKSKFKLVSKCYHVFYDSKNYLIADSYVENKNCNDALNHLNNATEPQSEFTVLSDILTVDSFRCVRKSLYEAIQTVLERWGGHLVRDNFDIAVLSSIGQDNGIIVQYKKNLKDISCQENWSNVVTKLLPVGKDGILLNAVNPSASIYVTSQTQYALPYCKTVSFSQDDIKQEDYQTEAAYKQALVNDLLSQAQAYVDKNCVPQINYTLKANLDRVTDIGDTVEVIDDRLGIKMMTNVIGFVYDCIFEKYTEVEFGNFANSLSNLLGNISSQTAQMVDASSQALQDELTEIMQKSYIIYDGTKILVLDSLPKESAQNVIKIDNTGIGFSQNGINGTYSSKWNIDGTIKLNNKTLDDFICDQGQTAGWTWNKYASGLCEAWMQLEVDSTDLTWTAFSTLQQADVDITFPFDINNALISASMESCSDVGWVASATTTDETGGTAKIIREGNTGDFTINIYVRGEL